MDEDFPDTPVLVVRKKLMQRNLAAMQPQGLPTGPYLRALAARQQAQASIPSVQPGGDSPEDQRRMASMAQMRLVGKPVIPGFAENISEVSGGDSADRHAIQGQLADPKMLANRMAQAEAALKSRNDMAAQGRSRPTQANQNEKRFAKRLELMQRMQDVQNAPMLAMLQAQHGTNPAQAAQANYHNAMAEAIRGQLAGGQQPASAPTPVSQHPAITVGPKGGGFLEPYRQFFNTGLMPNAAPGTYGRYGLPGGF